MKYFYFFVFIMFHFFNCVVAQTLTFSDPASSSYSISSLYDLNQLINLKKLKLFETNITRISHLGITGLEELWVANLNYIKNINISDLPNIKKLLITDCYVLDSLNIKNGSIVPDPFDPLQFSLFYTDSIRYACVDDILEEYNVVAKHMVENAEPTTQCEVVLSMSEAQNEVIKFYPNPTNGIIHFDDVNTIKHIKIYNVVGGLVRQVSEKMEKVDLSNLKKGVYFIAISDINNTISTIKLILY